LDIENDPDPSVDETGATPTQVVALYDYTPQTDSELSLRAGDVINILAQPTPEWWEGEIDGRPGWTGLFPANYVEPVANSNRTEGTSFTPPPPHHPPSYGSPYSRPYDYGGGNYNFRRGYDGW